MVTKKKRKAPRALLAWVKLVKVKAKTSLCRRSKRPVGCANKLMKGKYRWTGTKYVLKSKRTIKKRKSKKK